MLESKRSILVPFCGGLAAFAAIGLGTFAPTLRRKAGTAGDRDRIGSAGPRGAWSDPNQHGSAGCSRSPHCNVSQYALLCTLTTGSSETSPRKGHPFIGRARESPKEGDLRKAPSVEVFRSGSVSIASGTALHHRMVARRRTQRPSAV